MDKRTVSPAEAARRRRFHNFMQIYYCARQAWVMAAEYATSGYEWEMVQYKLENPPVLFKQYLIDSRGQPR